MIRFVCLGLLTTDQKHQLHNDQQCAKRKTMQTQFNIAGDYDSISLSIFSQPNVIISWGVSAKNCSRQTN